MIRSKSKLLNNTESRIRNRVGSITLEYILVSTFAAVASVVALGFMKTVVQKKMESLAKEFSLNFEDDKFDNFFKE